MYRRNASLIVLLAGVAPTLFALVFAGCQKKCQAPAEQVFKSFTDTEWRLVETDNPEVIPANPGGDLLSTTDRDLRFNFLIFKFNNSPMSGEVFKVERNEKLDSPVLLITRYAVDPANHRLAVEFASPTDGATKVEFYEYSLNREFELRELRTNFNYRFLPFTGVVNADSDCTF